MLSSVRAPSQKFLTINGTSTTYLITRTWDSALDAGGLSVTKTQLVTVKSPVPPYNGCAKSRNTCTTDVKTQQTNCTCASDDTVIACLW
jgi:hypothetical protein